MIFRHFLLFLTLLISFETLASNSDSDDDAYSYSVNMMWINLKKQDSQLFLVPGNEEEVRERLSILTSWAENNPDAEINFWYDSELTTDTSVAKTSHLLEKLCTEKNVRLRDLRDLPIVKEKPFSLSSRLPVYFRIDLAREFILYHLMYSRKTTYAVYADIDMQPLPKGELFDTDTLHNLTEYGIVLSKGGCHGYENGFQMVSHHNADLLRAKKRVLIDLNITRAETALVDLTKGKFSSPNSRFKSPLAFLQQVVYDSYPSMFGYFHALRTTKQLVIAPCGFVTESAMVVSTDDLEDRMLGIPIKSSFELLPCVPEYEKHHCFVGHQLLVPTKKVLLPPARYKYDDGL